MKKKNIIVLILILIVIFVGSTISYFSNKINLENIFGSNKYSTMISENFISPSNWKPGETVDKTFYVTNNGLDDIAVRIKYSEEWSDKDDNILSNVQNNENIAIINLPNNSNWIKDGDYYYYKYILKSNNTTSTFLESVTFNQNIEYFINCNNSNNKNVCKYGIGDYEDATYKLTFIVETIQFNMYNDVWNTTVEILDN